MWTFTTITQTRKEAGYESVNVQVVSDSDRVAYEMFQQTDVVLNKLISAFQPQPYIFIFILFSRTRRQRTDNLIETVWVDLPLPSPRTDREERRDQK